MASGLNIDNIINELSKGRLLVLGDVMLDRYWWGTVDRVSPEAPVPVVRLDQTTAAPGGAANVALNLSGLGCAAYLIGLAGDDKEALELGALVAKHGVRPEIIKSQQRQTIVKTRIVAHGQHVVRIDQETIGSPTSIEVDKMVNALKSTIDDIDAIILSDYGKGTFNGDLLPEILAIARAAGKPVFVDPKGSKFDKYLGATAITPNQREAMTACSIDAHVSEPVNVAGTELQKKLGAAILITEGERGMTLFESGQSSHHLDSFAREVFDVTGAGDTVIATFAAGVATGHSMKEAAWLANVAAGIVVGKQGTTAITGTMLEEFLSSRQSEHLGLVSTA